MPQPGVFAASTYEGTIRTVQTMLMDYVREASFGLKTVLIIIHFSHRNWLQWIKCITIELHRISCHYNSINFAHKAAKLKLMHILQNVNGSQNFCSL